MRNLNHWQRRAILDRINQSRDFHSQDRRALALERLKQAAKEQAEKEDK